MINNYSDICKAHYKDDDIKNISPDFLHFISSHNPYMGDGVKLAKNNPEVALDLGLCHKAWLEGAINTYKFLQEVK